MPVSAPPYSPSTGTVSPAARSIGLRGCRSSAWPARRPYQATPALTLGLCAAYSQTMRPPQQNPVMPTEAASARPWDRHQPSVASRSLITCASGTWLTTSLMMRWMSAIPETSPWRTNSSGATAK